VPHALNNCWGADEKGHEKEDRKLDCCLSFTFFVVFQNQTFGGSTRSSKSISVSSQAECKQKNKNKNHHVICDQLIQEFIFPATFLAIITGET